MSSSAVEVALRPTRETDLQRLFEVYASTRAEELAPVPWSDEQKHAFLAQQFTAQHEWWQQQYQGADFLGIEVGGELVGRLYLFRSEGEMRIVDIALLPAWRGRGIGSRLLTEVLTEADRAGLAVTIHVEKNNPARALYQRLGFEIVADRGVYDFWRRAPSGPGT